MDDMDEKSDCFDEDDEDNDDVSSEGIDCGDDLFYSLF